jgi:hypothetical protein
LSAADAEALGQPVRRFIADHIIPLEQEAFAAGVGDKLRFQMQQLAHDAGVLAPQAPVGYGGGGADLVTTTVLLEEAGYSPLGPLAMNCAASDEGNMHLLAVVGTEEQKERYLRPLVRDEMRSCFKAEFGASKQPVMEALRRLSSEGLVEIIPQVRCRVPVYDGADASDFFAIFGGTERAVAGVAAQRCTEAQVDELAAVNAEIRQLVTEADPSARPSLPRPQPPLPRRCPRDGPLGGRDRNQPQDVGHVRPGDQHQRRVAAPGISRLPTLRRPRAHHPRSARSRSARRPPRDGGTHSRHCGDHQRGGAGGLLSIVPPVRYSFSGTNGRRRTLCSLFAVRSARV